MPEPDAKQLRDTVSEIVRAYRYFRQRIHPSFVLSNRFDSCWEKIARQVLSLQANPRLYMEAQFSRTDVPHPGCPLPTNMFSERAREAYEEFIGRFSGGKDSAYFSQQMGYLTQCVTAKKGMADADDIVLSPIHSFRAYFRVFMCSDERLSEALRLYGGQARRQLENSPELQETLQQINHDRLRQILTFTALQPGLSNPPAGAPGPQSGTQ